MLRLYLKKEVEKRDGYIELGNEAMNPDSSIECIFAGRTIYSGKAKHKNFSLRLDDLNEYLPEEFQGLIAAISLAETISSVSLGNRKAGRYREGSAIATLERELISKKLEIKGDKLEDVKNLYNKIRAGQIKPFEIWE